MRLGSGSFDPGKPAGLGQKAPLTPEYQAILRGQPGGPGGRRAGQRPDLDLPCARHAAHHDRLRGDGDRGHAGDHLFLIEPYPRLAPHLHRRARLAGGDRADLPGLFDRQLVDEDGDGRYDALEVETRGFQGPAHLRQHRHSAAPGQSDRHQGADLSRQGRPDVLTTRSPSSTMR